MTDLSDLFFFNGDLDEARALLLEKIKRKLESGKKNELADEFIRLAEVERHDGKIINA